MQKQVIIVGGGISGLAAASELRESQVVLLESKDRLGGRIHTVASGGTPVELGAEFVHGRSPALMNALLAAGLTTEPVSNRNQILSDGGLEPVEVWEKFGQLTRGINPQEKDKAFSEFLASQELDERTRRMLLTFAEGFNAADANRLGAHGLRRANYASEQMEGASQMRVSKGYGELVSYLEHQAREAGAILHTNATVHAVHWREGHVKIEANVGGEQRVFTGDAAIITLPLGVLKAGDVAFHPALPAKAEAISGLEFGHVSKVTFSFQRAWWPEQDFGFIHALGELLPTWWSYPDSAMLTGWAGGPKAEALREHSSTQLEQVGLEILSRIFSMPVGSIRAELVSTHTHNWARDPFVRGAYSYIPVGGIYLPKQLGAPVADTLFFAGEATARDAQMGTVFGAYESGLRAAAEIQGAPSPALADASILR